jgi:nitrite reductase/ring-hydroxylating ferredoxin subunit
MSNRSMRRFVERLLRGRSTQRLRPDDYEAQQIRAAIELRAARGDVPRKEFVADLHQRLAHELAEAGPSGSPLEAMPRRQVVVAGTAAAASAAVGLVLGRTIASPPDRGQMSANGSMVDPTLGAWQPIGPSSDLPAGRAMAFDLGSVSGFVHRADDGLRAVSAICTHQGCKLSLDAPDRRLRCPCHRTSFSLAGETVTHQLPVAPPPLPTFRVREVDGVIQVYAPVESA